MKPASFIYKSPGSVDDALTLLANHQTEAQILAGGQSLGPMMNLRLARPEVIVDINRILALGDIDVTSKGELTMGATVRQHQVEISTAVGESWPLLTEAVSQIGHRAIRNRGTIGGSVSHADPAAELPAALVALDARFKLGSERGERELSADEFFVGPFTTARHEDEMLLEVAVPPPRRGSAQTWVEYARRDGDFGIVGVAAVLTLDDAFLVEDVRLVFSGADWQPWEPSALRSLLVGNDPTQDLLNEAGRSAAAESDPPGDIHASSGYRRSLIAVLASRALAICVARNHATMGET